LSAPLAKVVQPIVSGGEAIEVALLNKARKTRARWRIIVIFLPVAVVVSLAVTIRGVGHWLVVTDPLVHAQAVVVLSGHVPFRAMEAASIYRQGWAPEVWLTKTIRPAEEGALAQLGIGVVRGETYNREVLERLGVPPDAIRNTEEEVQLIAHELKRAGGERVILVTSKPHTRRVKTIWNTLEEQKDGQLMQQVRSVYVSTRREKASLEAPFSPAYTLAEKNEIWRAATTSAPMVPVRSCPPANPVAHRSNNYRP